MTFDEVMSIYLGSDAERTRMLYRTLEVHPPRGIVAVNLLRTCKASERAKKYRGRSGRGQPTYRAQAYDKKDWSIGELCGAMRDTPDVIQSWGWGLDPKAIGFEHVLYIDLPFVGQVSFHAEHRRDGPTYDGAWDGVRHQAPIRICRWTEAVLAGTEATSKGDDYGSRQDRSEGAAATGVEQKQAGTPEPDPRQEALDL